MTALLLSAGRASRLGDMAPGGCKAMTVVGGRTMIDWWGDLLGGRPTVVCRSEHLPVVPDDVDTVICDEGGGPAVALASALPACDLAEPITVGFADTWLQRLPEGPAWCAVAAADPGRAWDVVDDGIVWYGDPGETSLVCVGAYRFAEHHRLAQACAVAIGDAYVRRGEAPMGAVVNAYGLPFVSVPCWQDVGDPGALDRWRAA